MAVNVLVPVSVVAAIAAGAAMLRVVHGGPLAVAARRAIPPLIAAVAAVAITAGAGVVMDAAPPGFLIALAAFTLPVLLALDAAAAASGARDGARWLILLSWAVVVFPLATIVPLALTRDCTAADCRIDDFAGALPLIVSSAAFTVLAPISPRPGLGVPPHLETTVRGSGRPAEPRLLLALLALWLAFAVWIASLEGALDDYIPRILVHALAVPAAAALGWALVDRLRGATRPAGRSLLLGLVAGMVAAMPGTVAVGMPWAPITGALAGALAGLTFGAAFPRDAPVRWALSLLVSALVGLLGPAISGEAVGAIFTARLAGVLTPLVAFVVTAVAALVLSAPVGLAVRRAREGRDAEGG